MLQIPKSLKGIVQGKGITDKTAYVAALVGVTMAQNAMATYIHTGEMPEGLDFFAYRTGGTDAATGEPERAMVPGYMKDVLAWALEGANKEAVNKLNPGLKTAAELWNNLDYKNQPIHNENDPALDQAGQIAGYAGDQALPITLEDAPKAEQGSELSLPERLMGIRPAPRYLTDPEGTSQAKKDRMQRAWEAKQSTEDAMKSRLAQ